MSRAARRSPARAAGQSRLRRAVIAASIALTGVGQAMAQPLPAPPEPAPPGAALSRDQAVALERLRDEAGAPQTRERYLREAHALLQRFWGTQRMPRLLFAGDRASGCGAGVVQHPMAFYCPTSLEIAMALDLRRAVRAARGRSPRELLLLDLAVLAHEWGHHVNRERGQGPYRSGMALTVRQEELASDWRAGIVLGWLLSQQVIGVDDYTQTANLLFEMGDYERLAQQHHGFPRDRFQALTRGLASQLSPGQRLGDWTIDTPETFSRPLPLTVGETAGATRLYEVRRFEINRSGQIATNLLGGLLGAASCVWGNRQQCLNMAMQQGKGRADGRYTQRRLSLDCSSGQFDVSDDDFGRQPLGRDGKGQAAVLAARDCALGAPAVNAGGS